jgi:hypothetical protein
LDIPDPAEHKRRIRAVKDGLYLRFHTYLKDAVETSRETVIQVTPMDGIPYQVRNEVFEAWNNAGWNVKYHDDQREGAWITITPR